MNRAPTRRILFCVFCVFCGYSFRLRSSPRFERSAAIERLEQLKLLRFRYSAIQPVDVTRLIQLLDKACVDKILGIGGLGRRDALCEIIEDRLEALPRRGRVDLNKTL